MFWQKKPPEEPTKQELINCAVEYFTKYLDGLNAGTVKANCGPLNISVSFTVTEEKGNHV